MKTPKEVGTMMIHEMVLIMFTKGMSKFVFPWVTMSPLNIPKINGVEIALRREEEVVAEMLSSVLPPASW